MTYTFWFEITGEDSDLYGEQFFTELYTADEDEHLDYAAELFPDEELTCHGCVNNYEAERMGLDTY